MALFLLRLASLLLLAGANRIQLMRNVLVPSESFIILDYSMPNQTASYDETDITHSVEFRLVFLRKATNRAICRKTRATRPRSTSS